MSETRSAFQHATSDRLVRAVEGLCLRPVETFMSTHHVGPDLEVELFMFAPLP